MDLREFTRRKGEIERLASDAARAEGAYAIELQRLRDEFGVASVEEGEAEHERVRAQAEEAAAAYRELERDFQARWGDKLR